MQPTSNRSARRLRGAPARRAAPNIWMQPREEKNISEGAFVPENCSRAVTELSCLILNNSGSSTEWSRGPTWTELTSQNGLITLVCKMEQNRSICALFQYKQVGFPNAAIYTTPPDFMTSKRLQNEASATTVTPRPGNRPDGFGNIFYIFTLFMFALISLHMETETPLK